MPNSPKVHRHNGYKGKSESKRIADQSRPTAHQRGYTIRWHRASKAYLARNPLCVRCMKRGEYTAATVTDHIKPHKGDRDLFWNEANWQALCKRCHDKKTATEDGGFGKEKVRM